MKILKLIGIGFVFLWFMLGGVGHFLNAEFFLAIMPPYVPYQLPVVYISGALEILGAAGLLFARTRTLAGNGLFVLTIAVTPANIYMSMNPELFPDVSPFFLSVRLVVQVLLLACIWWCTRPPSESAATAEPVG